MSPDRPQTCGRPSHDLTAEVFDGFPHGLIVCERDGRILAANQRARELAGVDLDGGSTCCSVLGCGRPGTALDGGCLSRMAFEPRGVRVQELRLDLPAGGVSATATPLPPWRTRVVIELRPAQATDAARSEERRLRIVALGRLRVETADGSLSGDWLDQRPGQLLRCLICARHKTVPIEVLAEAIWRQAGPSAPNTVRHFVSALRDRLEPDRPRHAESSFVVSRRGGYALDADNVWIDADDFEAEVQNGLRAFALDDMVTARASLERAIALYRGDLLADDPYAEWALPERERLRGLVANALRALGRLTSDEPEEALAYLERLAQLEPFDNDAARELISAWLRLGRRSRAARYYQAFRLRLLREFGEQPDFGLYDIVPSRVPAAGVVG